MTWTWTFENADGEVVGRSEVFESRGDAESWIGEAFGELLEGHPPLDPKLTQLGPDRAHDLVPGEGDLERLEIGALRRTPRR